MRDPTSYEQLSLEIVGSRWSFLHKTRQKTLLWFDSWQHCLSTIAGIKIAEINFWFSHNLDPVLPIACVPSGAAWPADGPVWIASVSPVHYLYTNERTDFKEPASKSVCG
jgi:hypothetical protein